MKKIVANTLIVGTQLMVGALFLVGLFNSKTEDDMVAVVENNNLSKMADVVNVMFVANTTDGNVFLESKENKEEENVENKEEVLESFNEEVEEKEVVEKVEEPTYIEEAPTYNVIKTYTGSLTGYGPNCSGCSGRTASGYDVRNTSTYTDSEFGEVRIVAADKSIPFYTIVRISNIPDTDPIIAIVLDTGGAVGFGKHTLFDLLFPSEAVAMHKTDNVKFEILREGA